MDSSRLMQDSLSNLLARSSNKRRRKDVDRFMHSRQKLNLATNQVKKRLEEPLQVGSTNDTAQCAGNDKQARYRSEPNTTTTFYFNFFTIA